jgi:uncharacterized protein YndB with AHSA1/START domain
MPATPAETSVIEHEVRVAARPGTVFAFFTDPAKMVHMSGEFVEVDPHRRIALTWGWEEELLALPPQSTAVEVSLTPDGKDTILRLTHRRLPADAVEFHRLGWEHYLPRLMIAASGGNPGPDPWQMAPDSN